MKKILFLIFCCFAAMNLFAQVQPAPGQARMAKKISDRIINFEKKQDRPKTKVAADSIPWEQVSTNTENQLTNAMPVFTKENTRQLSKTLFTPLATSSNPFVSDKANVSLESQFGDQFASASFGFSRRNFSLDAVLKQPFQEKPKEVNPFSLDGLDNGSSFKLGFQWNFNALRDQATIEKMYEKLKQKVYQRKNPRKVDCKDLVTMIADGKESFYVMQNGKRINIDSLRKTGCCCEDAQKSGVGAFYTLDSLTDGTEIADAANLLPADIGKDAMKEFLKSIIYKRWFLGFSMSVAKTSFDYIPDSFTLRPTYNEKHINQSYKLNAGYIFNGWDEEKMSVLAFTFSYSHSYEAGSDPVDYTFPVGTAGLSYQKNVTIGVPTSGPNTRAAFEYRRRINLFANHPIAISPSVSYLFNKKSLALVLPVYIFQYKKDDKLAGLQGGLRAGYRTATNQSRLTSFAKGFSASVFISAPFDMFSF